MITSKPHPWLLTVLAFCSFLVGYDSIVTVPLLPEISKSTNMPLSSGGLLYVSYAVAYAISAPLMGIISDRWSRKNLLMSGMLLFGISTALVGTGETFAALMMFRILSGIGAGMIEPAVYAIVGDVYPYEQRGRAMGVVTAALISSTVLGVPLAGYITELTAWNWTFWIIALLSAVAFLAIFFVVADTNHKEQSHKLPLSQTVKSALNKSSIFFSLLGSLLYYGALQGMFVLAGVYYFTFYGLGTGETGLVLMAAGLSSVVGSLVGGKLADQWNKKLVVSAASLMSAIFVFALSLTTSHLWTSIILHMVWAALYAVGQSAFNALISELNPQSRGTVMSLNSSAMYIGAGVLSTFAAGMLNFGSFWHIGLMCAAANLLVAVISLFAIHENHNASKRIQNRNHPER